MSHTLGIVAAVIAFLGWGFGDFMIQRSIRKIGTLETLFVICASGGIILLPFVWSDLPYLFSHGHAMRLLTLTTLTGLFSAMLNFEAYKQGKLAVIEPVMSFELVITALFGIFLIGEQIRLVQLLLMAAVFVGILLTMLTVYEKRWWHLGSYRKKIEKGVLLALVGAVIMSGYNVYTGLASQATNPLIAIWYTHFGIGLILFVWFVFRRKVAVVVRTSISAWRMVGLASVLDNVAWLGFATAVLVLPISVTIGITESYVALAAVLGMILNRERLRKHQYVGMSLAIISGIILAIISSR